jgi:Tol biopolymer transport system component
VIDALLPGRRHDRLWGATLSAWRDGETTPEESAALARHLAGCDRCQRRLAWFDTLDLGVRHLAESTAPPPVTPLFEAAARRRGRRWALPHGLGVGAAFAAVLALCAISPAGQALIGGATGVAQRLVSPAPALNYAGNHALFHAQPGDAIVYEARRYGIASASADGARVTPLGSTLVSGGTIWSLSGDRILYDAGQDGQHIWTVADADGSQPTALPNAGNRQVVDVTNDGDEILLRAMAADGTPATKPGSSIVLDPNGAVLWRDTQASGANGVNAQALSADGSAVLSGDTGWVRGYRLDGGPALQVPVGKVDVRDPQQATNGAIAYAATALDGENAGSTTVYYYQPGQAPGVPRSDIYPQGSQPVFALSPDGALLAVWGRQGSQTLKIWGMSGALSGKVWQETQLAGANVVALRWSADGRSLLVNTSDDVGGARALLLTPAADLASATTVNLDSSASVRSAAWRSDGSLLLLSDSGAASGLLAVSNAGVRPLLAAADPETQPIFSPTGDAALLLDGKPPTLLEQRGSDPPAVAAPASALAWAPDGKRAAVVSGDDVYLYDTQRGLASAPLTAGVSALWSARGDRLLVVRADGSADVIDMTGAVHAHAPSGMLGASLVWSPSENLLAGILRSSDHDAVAVWNPQNGAITVLADAPGGARLAWSPDGRRIAYGADTANGAALFVVGADGGAGRQIASLAAVDDDFVWRADNKSLLVVRRSAPDTPGALTEVYVNGSAARTLGLPSVAHLYDGPR